MARAYALIRSRVESATSGLSRSASETVAVETPSASAMVDSLIFRVRGPLRKGVTIPV
jgi:hypothetical protein